MKTKSLVIGCSVAFIILFTLVVIWGWSLYKNHILPFKTKMPPEIKDVRLVVANLPMTKKVFLPTPQVGRVTSIVFGELDPTSESEIGLAGNKGALFVDRQANIKASVQFNYQSNSDILGLSVPPIIGDVEIIDIEGDHICEFLNRGGIDGASLIDHQGKTLWVYGKYTNLSDMAAGDVDGDGIAEFVVGHGGDGGVELLDRYGRKQWQQPDGNVWQVGVADIRGTGTRKIVHSNVGGDIIIRDAKGAITSQTDLPLYLGAFSFCKWPKKTDRQYILTVAKGSIWLLDFDGKIVAQLKAPLSDMAYEARGTLVKLISSEPEYLAVVVKFAGLSRSVLYLFNATGELLYQEVLGESCEAIAPILLDDSDSETILIGGDQKVWQYNIENPNQKE